MEQCATSDQTFTMNKSLFAAALSGTLLVGVLAPRAQAQLDMSNNYYSSGWVNPYNNTMTQIYQSNINRIYSNSLMNSQLLMAESRIHSRAGSHSSASSRRAARLKAIPVRERSEAVRFAKYQGTMYHTGKSVMPARLAAAFADGTKHPENRAAFEKLFTIFVNGYKDRSKQLNAPATDIARTLAFCIAANYYHRSGTLPSEAQIGALRGKIRTALSEDKSFRALSNAQKQEMNETLVILTFLVDYGIENVAPKLEASKREQVKTGFRGLADINLKGMVGVDPKRLAFDEGGLVIS